MRCKNHDYMYVNEAWMDENTGVSYRKGYYDEDGNYYDADSLVFKKPDGSYEAHYVCEFCGTELEANWREGFYPSCKNCGAEMNKTPVYIDEIVNINAEASYNDSYKPVKQRVNRLLVSMLVSVCAPFIIMIIMFSTMNRKYEGTEYIPIHDEEAYLEETNLEIYGNDIYLDEVSPNVYRICTQQDAYEKHITWDYGAQCYYDYDSDCYLWYNTDVSPNLWQYWYDDIAGDNYYGWMECDGDDWYIEISETEWEKYEGDTTELWYIDNEVESF